jgi:hypothetical protein
MIIMKLVMYMSCHLKSSQEHTSLIVPIFFIASGVGLRPLYNGRFWPIVPAPDDRWGWLWSNCGMKIGRGNRSTRRKPALAPLCPPQIPLDQTRDRTRAAAVGSQRLTAWAMARPIVPISNIHIAASQSVEIITLMLPEFPNESTLNLVHTCVSCHPR